MSIMNDYDRYHYNDDDLKRTMRFEQFCTEHAEDFTEHIRNALAEDTDPDMGNYVLRVVKQVDRHEITDPYDAAMHMFTALVGWDFNSLAEFCRADYEDIEVGK